jgi:hypothetical protein
MDTYRVHWNYATKTGKIDMRRAAQSTVVKAESAEAAAAIVGAVSYRIVGSVQKV